VLDKDSRDLDGSYDKLVSIEMIEATGDDHLDVFFSRCGRLLAPEGLMAFQTITIADDEFDRHRREVDFIKRYIFPGSCIPSVTAIAQSMTRSCDSRLYLAYCEGGFAERYLGEVRLVLVKPAWRL